MITSALAVSALLMVAGCDPGTVYVVGDSGPPDDAATLLMSRVLGRCVADWQCPGPGGFCRTSDQGYPSGQCTTPCTDRTACDDGSHYNECLQLTGSSSMVCEAYCRNGSDCRAGYTCNVLSMDASGAPRGVCIPVCATDDECGGTSQCDTYTGRCVPHGTVGTAGALTGEACTGATACRSHTCRTSMEMGNYTGFVGGYCQSLCRIPTGFNTNNFFDGDALPQGNCTGDAVCIPGGNEQGVGDLGVCLDQCSSAADCRDGYTCRQTVGTHTFTNGWCTPVNCMAAGMACPAGTTCHAAQDAQGNVYGICG